MNLIQYNNQDISLNEIAGHCKYNENVVLINEDKEDGIAIMNKSLLGKIALSSFLAKAIEDVKNGNLIDGESFFNDLESRLRIC